MGKRERSDGAVQRQLAAFNATCMDHTWNYCCCRMVTEGEPPMSYKKARVLLLALEKDTLAHEPRGEAQAEGFSTRH